MKNAIPCPSKTERRGRGAALIMALTMIAIVFGLSVTMLSYVTTTKKASDMYSAHITTLQIADSGLQKALFCLRATNGSDCGGTYGDFYAGESGVVVGGGTVDIVVDCVGEAGGGGCSTPGSDVTVTAVGTSRHGRQSYVQIVVSKQLLETEMTQFDFAVQGGEDGIDMSNNAKICRGDVYVDGGMACGNNAEMYGDVVISGEGNAIDNCKIMGSARADSIIDSDICCDAYFDRDPEDISGTFVGGTEYPNSDTPEEEPMPEIDLEHWREVTSAGGTVSGDYEPGDGDSFGPIKIDGDLEIGSNADVTLTGPIWVTGDIHMNNNSSMTLDAGFGNTSTVILADNPADNSAGGQIVTDNNATISATGFTGSYVMVVSTNDSLEESRGDCAIDILNNASGDAIFYALNGSVCLRNNTSAAAVAGQKVALVNQSVISFGCEENCDDIEEPKGYFCSCSFEETCECEMSAESSCRQPDDIWLADGTEKWTIVPESWREL